jgi:hypothetical protein
VLVTTTFDTVTDVVLPAATGALAAYAAAERNGRAGWDRPADAGPALLAALVADQQGEVPVSANAALAAWLSDVRAGCTHLGLYNWGLAGIVAGLDAAVRAWPGLARTTERLRSELVERAGRRPWLPAEIGWGDYDLISGPAGITLVLARGQAIPVPDGAAADAQLTDLAGHDDLAALRLGQFRFEEYRGWNFGRVNTGVAHGVAGVALALCAAADAWGTRFERMAALDRIGGWLRTEAHRSAYDVVSWHRGERRGNTLWTPPRGLPNAWCYGAPGISWALWEIARVRADADLRQFAETAFTSYLSHPKQHDLTGLSGFCMCHGAAGEMMICDAFDRYAGLAAAGERRHLLEQRISARLDPVTAWAARDATVLSGSSGVLAALLTVRGADRGWLAGFGLR